METLNNTQKLHTKIFHVHIMCIVPFSAEPQNSQAHAIPPRMKLLPKLFSLIDSA